MTRTKNFTREDVLEKAVPLFWKKGFAQTSVHDLETATGVNKSGLYSEFENKEELYLASLSYYLDERRCGEWLTQTPLGWNNIENFLNQAEYRSREMHGCLMVFAIREIPILSREAQEKVVKHHNAIRSRVLKNLEAELPGEKAERIADLIMVLFSGIALLHNFCKRKEPVQLSVSDFMGLIKSL